MGFSRWTLCCVVALLLCVSIANSKEIPRNHGVSESEEYRTGTEEDLIIENVKDLADDLKILWAEDDNNDTKTDKCDSAGCQNDGECAIEDGKAICKCKERYTGEKCETDKCDSVGCQNDGECAIEDGKAICKCKERYMGEKCETDKCELLQCQNEGTCVIKNGEAICNCKEKYTGDKCETECDCGEFGDCSIDKDGKKVCNCKTGYGDNGGTCEINCKDDDECGENELCNEKKFCACKDGYEGEGCLKITGCDKIQKDCKNARATCVFDEPGKPKCKCNQKGYTYVNKKCVVDKCKETCGVDRDDKSGEVLCDLNDSGEAACSCQDTKKVFKDKACEADKCWEACGVASDDKKGPVLCDGGPFGNVQCSCKEEKQAFNKDTKKCQADKCWDACGVASDKKEGPVLCDGGPFGNVRCSCIDKKQTFIKEEKNCQDKCIAKCGVAEDAENGDVKCVIDSSNKAVCSCRDTKKVFKDKTCQDKCIANCGVEEDDKKGEVLCARNSSGEAVCSCTDPKKVFTEDKTCEDKCIAMCGVSEDKKDGEVLCVRDGSGKAVCSCKEPKQVFKDKICGADKCIDECGIAHDKTDGEVLCEGGPFGQVTCKCKTEGNVFDNDGDKKCKADKCIAECGIAHDKKDGEELCEGGPFGQVSCKCKTNVNAFDSKDKKCKADKCIAQCGIAHDKTDGEELCEGDPFGTVTCKCRTKKNAFDIDGNKKCKADKCFEKCGVAFDAKDGEVSLCKGGPFGDSITCHCAEDKAFDPEEKQCRRTCKEVDTDCDNGAKCVKRGDKNFCKCLPGTTGDTCGDVTECSSRLKECKDDKGKCEYDKEEKKAKCNCKDGQKFNEDVQHCQAKCETDEECGENKKCNERKFCVCKPGYEGDDCLKVTGCDKIQKECEKADATCVFDEPGNPKCKCNQEGYTYIDKKCVSEFCDKNPCKKPAECEFDKENKIGYCKCEEGKYYDYNAGQCKQPDACLLRKEPCGDNKVCKAGKCECAENFEADGDKCKLKSCVKSCFKNANCTAEDPKCTCLEGDFYNGNECKNASCILNDFKKKCNCPDSWSRDENGNCVPKKGELCDKDCGYGYCIKDGDAELCECVKSPLIKPVDGTCVLNAQRVCASKQLTDDKKKCNCTGRYKEAADGITCELITCNDKDAKDECDAQGANCKTNWKPSSAEKGYTCECPAGYTLDSDKGKCTDSCSLDNLKLQCQTQNKLCYNTKSSKNKLTVDCRCPPPLVDNEGKCSQVAEHFYFLNNLPILKKNYEVKGKIDYVKLNNDIKDSLLTMFGENIFEYGYLYKYKEQGNVLKCDTWMKFKNDPAAELRRIRYQAQKFNMSSTCDECDVDQVLWPPNLLMNEPDMDKVEPQELEGGLCSDFSRNMLCGKGAGCKDNKCFCAQGYKPLEFTLRTLGDNVVVQRCEDIDECETGVASCPDNTECVNTPGDYGCRCKEGFKKVQESESVHDKGACSDLCSPTPCINGDCSLVNKTFECKCKAGYTGALCNTLDAHFKKAKHDTVVVGAVLGTIIGVALIAFLLYYRKVRRSSYSEDFMPAPRQDHPAEMMERRPMRGVVNKSYE